MSLPFLATVEVAIPKNVSEEEMKGFLIRSGYSKIRRKRKKVLVEGQQDVDDGHVARAGDKQVRV